MVEAKREGTKHLVFKAVWKAEMMPGSSNKRAEEEVRREQRVKVVLLVLWCRLKPECFQILLIASIEVQIMLENKKLAAFARGDTDTANQFGRQIVALKGVINGDTSEQVNLSAANHSNLCSEPVTFALGKFK